MLFYFLLPTLVGSYGALTARLDGAGTLPKILSRFLCILPFALGCYVFAGWCSIFALLGFLGIATGHGQYFLDAQNKAMSPEFFDKVVSLIFGNDPRVNSFFLYYRDDMWKSAPEPVKEFLKEDIERYGRKKLYWRCLCGMLVTGTVVGLPAAILSAVFELPLFVTLVFLSTGIVKAVAYYVGQKIFNSTEYAELINGAVRTLIVLIPLGSV